MPIPSVPDMSDSLLRGTFAPGEHGYNSSLADVMAAIQVMRKRAMDAGTLKSTQQQKVEVQSAPAQTGGAAGPMVEGGQPQLAQQQVVVIQPAQPNVVYVPTYNPTTVYGAPVASPPGYTGYSGTEMLAAGVVSFGAGMLLGSLINGGYNSWGTNWKSATWLATATSNHPTVAGRYDKRIWRLPSALSVARPGYPGTAAVTARLVLLRWWTPRSVWWPAAVRIRARSRPIGQTLGVTIRTSSRRTFPNPARFPTARKTRATPGGAGLAGNRPEAILREPPAW